MIPTYHQFYYHLFIRYAEAKAKGETINNSKMQISQLINTCILDILYYF